MELIERQGFAVLKHFNVCLMLQNFIEAQKKEKKEKYHKNVLSGTHVPTGCVFETPDLIDSFLLSLLPQMMKYHTATPTICCFVTGNFSVLYSTVRNRFFDCSAQVEQDPVDSIPSCLNEIYNYAIRVKGSVYFALRTLQIAMQSIHSPLNQSTMRTALSINGYCRANRGTCGVTIIAIGSDLQYASSNPK